mmetsp:Transcript_64659/g.115012  ORF Transcript_64659/g.115012 Transcript_64659/m.115012 type:complete len:141 (-) Transcript_64659:622-1044(-)
MSAGSRIMEVTSHCHKTQLQAAQSWFEKLCVLLILRAQITSCLLHCSIDVRGSVSLISQILVQATTCWPQKEQKRCEVLRLGLPQNTQNLPTMGCFRRRGCFTSSSWPQVDAGTLPHWPSKPWSWAMVYIVLASYVMASP